MLCTALFHVPPDSVTAPDDTRSGILSGSTGGVGDAAGIEGEGVDCVALLPRGSGALFGASEQAEKAKQVSETTARTYATAKRILSQTSPEF